MSHVMKPSWLKKDSPLLPVASPATALLNKLNLHTICEETCCPNRGECFSHGVVTFLILGDICTRHCRFCAVAHGKPLPVDAGEPERIANMVRELGIKHVVVTSVTRDDLPDGGSEQFARVIQAIHECTPGTTVEVLVPDFNGLLSCLDVILAAGPEVVGHNIETVRGLYVAIRPEADYARSLELLAGIKHAGKNILTKSALMLGLGETREAVLQVMADLRTVNCDFLILGQYLQPSPDQYPVLRYVPPAEFKEYEKEAQLMGFRAVLSEPFARSSYRADAMLQKARKPITQLD